MKIVIPFKTPTINHLHGFWRGHVVLKPEAKKLKKEIIEITQEAMKTQYIWASPYDNSTPKLKLTVEVYEDWYCKNGTIKKKDIGNREKFLIDAIFEGLGIDDKFVFEHTMKKIQSTEEKAVITIEVLNG